jgi:hypothetical protein
MQAVTKAWTHGILCLYKSQRKAIEGRKPKAEERIPFICQNSRDDRSTNLLPEPQQWSVSTCKSSCSSILIHVVLFMLILIHHTLSSESVYTCCWAGSLPWSRVITLGQWLGGLVGFSLVRTGWVRTPQKSKSWGRVGRGLRPSWPDLFWAKDVFGKTHFYTNSFYFIHLLKNFVVLSRIFLPIFK